MNVKKSDGSLEQYDKRKLISILKSVYNRVGLEYTKETGNQIIDSLYVYDGINCSSIRVQLEERLKERDERLLAEYKNYKSKQESTKDFVAQKKAFISKYKKSSNTANATVDDNSNVGCKNVAVMNAEIHKEDNIQISRGMIMDKLKELYPKFNAKNYVKDLKSHIIYKHDESSFAGAIAPYCASITMYPFLTDGIKKLGGLSAKPKNLDSFCGIYCNLVFNVSSQLAGACATPEFLLYFTYFCKKEWGEDFWKNPDKVIGFSQNKEKTIMTEIKQKWQQVIYTLSQPAGARNGQSPFINFSYFDKPFFDGMFGNFYFPDGTQPDWDSLWWIQKEFMKWFNEERLKCVLTFPVESFTLLYKDGEFADKEAYEFVCDEYARGHSFFTYISDTVDSLSSCCRLRNSLTTKEFSFTNGNIGVMTGSKSVITLNLSRIVQDWYNREKDKDEFFTFSSDQYPSLKKNIEDILECVYKYHEAYNELLWEMYDAGLLPVYKAGFIDLNKQYLTVGINGLNQAAEFLGMKCSDNEYYKKFCRELFGCIKDSNTSHNKTTESGHKLTFNTELVPAESLAVKNYNWDKEDGYWTPNDTNLYASYIFKPNDPSVSVLERIRMHGKNFASNQLDGGSAAHINLDHHLDKSQYEKIIKYAAETGCSYLTFNVPMSECPKCGYIVRRPIDECPKCGKKGLDHYDRIIGYLTKISNWSNGRQKEQKLRVYSDKVN